MPLTKLQFRPGVNRETTSYSNEGGWYDCDKVRFRFGTPEKIGGWEKLSDNSFLGTARALHSFVALDGTSYIGVGTHLKYYLEEGGGYSDITPLRKTTVAGAATFAAANGSSTLTVTDAAHGCNENDFVTFSGAVSLGGLITAAVLNQEYQILAVVNTSSYQIQAREVATLAQITVDGQYTPTLIVANGSDTGNGGASVIGEYQINIGLSTVIFGAGWGSDPWSDGAWGAAGSFSIASALRIWSIDEFGEDLIAGVRGGDIYYWDASLGTSARMVALSTLSGSNQAPTIGNWVLTSDQDRHAIVFGADPFDNVGVQDPLLIRWCDQENIAEWEDSSINTAGSNRLSHGSKIITAVQTKQQIFILTDSACYGMQFIGPPHTFGVQLLATRTTIAGPIAAAAIGDYVFWMGSGSFYVYDGSVKEIKCPLKEYVFESINLDQIDKVVCGSNSAFSEVWWWYPTDDGEENSRYVVYNYRENLWYNGTMVRTAWVDRGVVDFPMAACTGQYLYFHENGLNNGSPNPPVGLVPHIESSVVSIGNGDEFMFVDQVIPNMTFRNSENDPSVAVTLSARDWPGGGFDQTDDGTVTQSVSANIEEYTQRLDVRLRGRGLKFRVDGSGDLNGTWRLGTFRVRMTEDGQK